MDEWGGQWATVTLFQQFDSTCLLIKVEITLHFRVSTPETTCTIIKNQFVFEQCLQTVQNRDCLSLLKGPSSQIFGLVVLWLIGILTFKNVSYQIFASHKYRLSLQRIKWLENHICLEAI